MTIADQREQKLLQDTVEKNKKDKVMFMEYINQQKEQVSALKKENENLNAEIRKLSHGLGMSDQTKLELTHKTM